MKMPAANLMHCTKSSICQTGDFLAVVTVVGSDCGARFTSTFPSSNFHIRMQLPSAALLSCSVYPIVHTLLPHPSTKSEESCRSRGVARNLAYSGSSSVFESVQKTPNELISMTPIRQTRSRPQVGSPLVSGSQGN